MRQRLRLAGVVVLLWVACAPAHAQITLSAGFEHASLDLAGSGVSGATVTLAGRDNFNPGSWKWLYFAADGVQGVRPTFQIDDDFATGGSNLNDHEMMYSYDQEEWFFFDSNQRLASQDLYRFENATPFTEDRVYVAYGLPYSNTRAVEHTQSVLASPWASPTSSGDSNGVIGQSPGGTDDLGRTIPAHDLYGYRISDDGATSPKATVVLTGGVHANETLANHALEAMVDFLVGDSLEAALLRREAEFFVYPMVNPDGRVAGYNRSTVQAPNTDPNRVWDSPSYGGLTDVAAVGDAMLADTAGKTDVYIDFHSTVQKDDSHFAYIDLDRQMHRHPFWVALQQRDPTIEAIDSGLTNLTSARFGLVELGSPFSITFETRFIAGENADRFVEIGRDFGLAMADALNPGFGDLDFDGDLDGDDWALLAASAQSSTAGLATLEAYAAGDLNLDGWNDVQDFALFKDRFLETHGAAAFARMIAEVPEPTGAALAAAAVLLPAYRRTTPSTLPCPARRL